ncbi:MAG TPA: HAMP domain-containing sensor histidine kinase [Clostridium sp.]
MECILKKNDEKPFLCSKNNIVTEIDNHFISLTGYSNSELIGKSLTEISCMLKIDSQIYLQNIEDEYSCFMFTKEYEPIEVTISCERLKYNNENIYFIEENKNSSIKERFEFVKQLYTDRKTGISIISVPDLIILDINDNYLNFFDEPYNRIDNCIGKKHDIIISKYRGSEAEKRLNSVITSGKPYYVEEFEQDCCESGTTYWNISIVPMFVEGNLKYIINRILDVTEKVINRKRLNERVEIIKKQKQQLEAIAENISDQLVFIDKSGDYTLINKIAKPNLLYDIITIKNDYTALEQAEYFDMNGDLISYENLPVQRVIRGERISRYILIVKIKNTTTYTAVTGTPTYDTAGNFIGGVMIYRDITEKIRNRENEFLKTQYKALDTLIENLELGCAIASYPDLNIKYINNKYCNRLKKINPEIESSSIMGKNVFDIFKYSKHQRTKLEINLQKSIEKKSKSCFYYKKYIDAGEEKFLKIMCQPMFGLNNKVIEVIFIEIDITEEIKAQNRMEETLKIQDQMFSNISHELKTPLNVIFSTNQLMEFYLKNDSFEANSKKVSKGINIIKQNCYRFTKIINNIIDISKIESGFLKLNLSNENIVNITEDIVESVSDYIEEKGLNIVFDTNTEEKIIACDPDKIERIILNIISNAVKFTNRNGSIFINILDKGDTVEILIKDTGIGMEKKYLDNIFKRFHQIDKSLSRNAEGSGIGLSLVKLIVELHGGKISAESKPDEGSIFKIELPAMTIENPKVTPESKVINSKIERINVEFSDIYSIS